MLSHLPPSTTHNDIRNLSFTASIAPAPRRRDAKRDEEDENVVDLGANVWSSVQSVAPDEAKAAEMLSDITEIRMMRTAFLNSNGKALVSFKSGRSAKLFAKLVDRKILGGKLVSAWQHKPRRGEQVQTPASVALLEQMQKRSPGRVVMLKGLPAHITPERLERILHRSYDLATDKIQWQPKLRPSSAPWDKKQGTRTLGAVVQLRNLTPVEATASFLVRLETVSDAMRLVRKWHRNPWEGTSAFARAAKERREAIEKEDGHASQQEPTTDLEAVAEDQEPDEVEPASTPSEFHPFKVPLFADAYIMY